MIVFVERLCPSICAQNPTALVVFGDNLLGVGKAGQACIRDEPNAFGVPTKKAPSMLENAFFQDEEEFINLVKNKLDFLWEEHKRGRTIILPRQRIGTGLARLKEYSPKIDLLIAKFWEDAEKGWRT